MGVYLEERGEQVEGVDGAGAVAVSDQLAEVAPPGLLHVVAGRGLERRQDGGEERRGRRRGTAGPQRVVPPLF